MVAGGAAAGVFGSLLGLGGGVLIVPAADARLRAAAARGGRRLARLRDHDQQRRGRRLPRAPRREPAARDDPRAVHRDRRARRRLDRVPARRAAPVAACSRSLLVYVALTMVRAPRRPAAASPAPADDRACRGRRRRRRARAVPAAAPPPRPLQRPRDALCRRRATASATWPSASSARPSPGVVSALLGIGGGIVKVPLMHLVDGRAAAGRDRDEQPDDRHHRLGQRGHLPAPRRHRPVRRGPDRDRRLRRRDASARGSPIGSTRATCGCLFVVVLLYTAVQMLARAVRLSGRERRRR